MNAHSQWRIDMDVAQYIADNYINKQAAEEQAEAEGFLLLLGCWLAFIAVLSLAFGGAA